MLKIIIGILSKWTLAVLDTHEFQDYRPGLDVVPDPLTVFGYFDV